MDSALVIPVPAALAVEWAYGHYSDSELLHLADSLRPGRDVGIFILSLFGRRAWRDLRKQCRQYGNARCLITRTSHPVVAAWLTAYGARQLKQDLPGEYRYLADRQALDRFNGSSCVRLRQNPELLQSAIAGARPSGPGNAGETIS